MSSSMQMRGSRVTWSPDSPRNEAVKNPSQAGEPRGKEVFTTNYNYSQVIASGKPLSKKLYSQSSSSVLRELNMPLNRPYTILILLHDS